MREKAQGLKREIDNTLLQVSDQDKKKIRHLLMHACKKDPFSKLQMFFF